MKKFKTMNELFEYMVSLGNISKELKNAMEKEIKVVEECNEGGAEACLIIAETQADVDQLEKEYSLSKFKPEYSEYLKSTSGEWWWQRAYVFSDDGSGIIYFERTPLLP